jgi:hypothetical protein
MYSNIALHDHLFELVGPNAHILELGSGEGTIELKKRFKVVTTIEHDPEYLNLAEGVTYVHAPLKPYSNAYFRDATLWYDPEVIKTIPQTYDAILVDGPKGSQGRGGFFTHLNLFRKDVLFIFDDVHRMWEFRLMGRVAQALQTKATLHTGAEGRRWFGTVDAR